jgi:hypothetical protein
MSEHIAVIELDAYSLKYENVLAIGRALSWYGVEVKMWNSQMVSLLDMIDEVKPYHILYHSEVPERVVRKITSDPLVQMTDTKDFGNLVLSDLLSFKKMEPAPHFADANVCLLQYPEVEEITNLALQARFASKYTDTFRLFTMLKGGGAKNCGWLPKELHTLMLSSAKSVLALSKNTAVNAALCNDNVTIADSYGERPFTITRKELLDMSAIKAAEQYLPLMPEMLIKDVYKEDAYGAFL